MEYTKELYRKGTHKDSYAGKSDNKSRFLIDVKQTAPLHDYLSAMMSIKTSLIPGMTAVFLSLMKSTVLQEQSHLLEIITVQGMILDHPSGGVCRGVSRIFQRGIIWS